MFHPANAPICAPSARCSPSSGVRRSSSFLWLMTPSSPAVVWPVGPVASSPLGLPPLVHQPAIATRETSRKEPRMSDSTYDVVVLGSGTGGYSCAIRASELGKRVALIEKDERLGGTCLLRGCIPSKALLESASVMDRINRSEEWGIKASGEVDWPGVLESERHIVDKKVTGLTGLIKARKIDVIRGTGKLGGGPTVEVDGQSIQAGDVVLATGSYPRLLPGLEVTERIITSDQALVLDHLPSSVVIIGAGAIGMEFATVYRSFGAEVTVLEELPRLMPLGAGDSCDQDVAAFT